MMPFETGNGNFRIYKEVCKVIYQYQVIILVSPMQKAKVSETVSVSSG
jgi:hypothetical protein